MTLFESMTSAVLGGAFVAALAINPVFAATTVTAELWDKGADTEMMTGLGMSMRGDMATATMGIKLSAESAAAGEITFTATNTSKDTIHEMVLTPVTSPDEILPYDETMQKVDEDAAGHLGEVAELEPGTSGSLTLTVKPGTYILYCNIPGHYASGMWTLFTVK